MGNLFCQEDGWKTSHRRGPATDEGPQHQLKIEAGPAKLLHFLKHESQIPQVSTWNLSLIQPLEGTGWTEPPGGGVLKFGSWKWNNIE